MSPTSPPLPPSRRLLVRIVAVMVLAIVTIEGVILIPMVLHDRAEMRRRFFAEAEAAAWEAAPALVAALARGERPPFPEVGGAAVVVYDPLGRPLATTGDDPGLGPAAVALLARGAPVERGEEASGRCYLLLRLTRHEAVVGSIAVVKPADAMARATRAYLWRTLGLVLLICTFTALIVLLYLIRAVLRPVQQIVAANVATGAAGEEIIPEPKIPATELGEIMRTRNRMLTSLRVARVAVEAKNRELASWAQTLEERVAERTAALQQAQEQVVQAEKMAAIGKLAASVAHELNNPLGIIGASGEELRRTLAGVEEARRPLEILHSQVARCKRIIDALLDFTRRRPARPEPTDLAPFLEESLELLRPRARQEHKEIQLTVGAGVRATILPTQLQQAVVNLVANSLDAIPAGGAVHVGAEARGARVLLWVEDDGPGIPAPWVAQAFEPFFTTKLPGQGAGMGLAIAANFIHAQGATLVYESAASGGARMVIDLPGG